MTLEEYDAYVCIYVCELRVCLVFYKMKGLLNQPNKVLYLNFQHFFLKFFGSSIWCLLHVLGYFAV